MGCKELKQATLVLFCITPCFLIIFNYSYLFYCALTISNINKIYIFHSNID